MFPSTRRDLRAIYRLVSRANLALDTISEPHPTIALVRGNLASALELSKNLITRTVAKDIPNAAAELGAKGGRKTAERGSEYFKRIAAMRKTKAAGDLKKGSDSVEN